MTEFDAARWIEAADLAGMHPVVLIQADGRHGLYCDLLDVDRGIAPVATQEKAHTSAVCDELERRGRVILVSQDDGPDAG